MDNLIKIEIKNHYGIDHYYVTSEHQEYIKTLTNKKTVSISDLSALVELGFKLEINQPSIVL